MVNLYYKKTKTFILVFIFKNVSVSWHIHQILKISFKSNSNRIFILFLFIIFSFLAKININNKENIYLNKALDKDHTIIDDPENE